MSADIERQNMNKLQKAVKNFESRRETLLRQLNALESDGFQAIGKIAKSLEGKSVAIQENVSPLRKGKFVYEVTKVHGAKVVRNLGQVFEVIEYQAKLVERPKRFRPGYGKKLGDVYRKRISINRLNTLKVL